MIELIHNGGVLKKPDQPAIRDAQAVARVQLKPRLPCRVAREWRSGKTHDHPGLVEVELGPGTVEFVEFDSPRGEVR